MHPKSAHHRPVAKLLCLIQITLFGCSLLEEEDKRSASALDDDGRRGGAPCFCCSPLGVLRSILVPIPGTARPLHQTPPTLSVVACIVRCLEFLQFQQQIHSMAWGGLFLSLGRPTPEQQKSCLAAAGGFNYDPALHGASRPNSPASSETSDESLVQRGFFVNRSRVQLGSGAATFDHAKSALLSWRHLALGWANVEAETPVKAGTRFCICYKELIPWVMLPLQITYVADATTPGCCPLNEKGSGSMFAFGSGTLQGHMLAGEERFSVHLDEDDRVWYEVFSFSKPAHVLSALCYPYVQLRQKHFARHSGQALQRHVASSLASVAAADSSTCSAATATRKSISK